MSLILEIKSFCQETEELLDFSGFNMVCFFCCLPFLVVFHFHMRCYLTLFAYHLVGLIIKVLFPPWYLNNKPNDKQTRVEICMCIHTHTQRYSVNGNNGMKLLRICLQKGMVKLWFICFLNQFSVLHYRSCISHIFPFSLS